MCPPGVSGAPLGTLVAIMQRGVSVVPLRPLGMGGWESWPELHTTHVLSACSVERYKLEASRGAPWTEPAASSGQTQPEGGPGSTLDRQS